MRVISGLYKHRRFDVPRTFKARPTTDFAKENLFNVLRGYFDFEAEEVRALDLFSGTGSIGLELCSRGCVQVVSVEQDRQHYAFIRSVAESLKAEQWKVICGDAFRYISRAPQAFDFIFADPPYALERLGELPDLILSSPALLKEGGLLVLEHGKDYSFREHPFFREERIYGSVHFSFFIKEG
ncbi:MAG: RsmD family RNA methyltransferase [Bacteroidaceae bacterium]|jgi:16S rRNA (guanine966-N2)-methyltransferase